MKVKNDKEFLQKWIINAIKAPISISKISVKSIIEHQQKWVWNQTNHDVASPVNAIDQILVGTPLQHMTSFDDKECPLCKYSNSYMTEMP